MRILVIGSGGREHALVWKLSKSKLVKKIFVAPGNSGMEELAESLPIAVDKTVALADFAQSSKVDVTIVGSESPLVYGIADYFASRKLPIFGPTKAAARLEGSKVFSKKLMEKYGVPTAPFRIFRKEEEALGYLEGADFPIVIKADGLAGGKGALVARTHEEARKTVHGILTDRIFGEAGGQVVIEKHLTGEEVSILAFVDGEHFVLLPASQDHKQVFDNDQGPNTGGMGSYCPVPMVTQVLLEEIREKVFEPVVKAMAREGSPFQGILYAGLMLTSRGPQVLEFNVRLGDPEAQSILPLLKGDLMELIQATLERRLHQVKPSWEPRSCACVVLASEGYPGKYDLGREISGLKEVADLQDTLVFHGGTKREPGRLVTWGGRVLDVVGLGDTLESAVERVYDAVAKIRFQGMHFRSDIGTKAIKYKTFMSS